MSDAEPSGVRPGEGALKYSHSGYRYILGYGPDYFGIWDRERPGSPIVRFPRTDDGWDEAWSKFVAWEPHYVDASEATSAGQFASAHTRARWTVALLSLHVVAALLVAIYFFSEIADLAGQSTAGAAGGLHRVKEQTDAVIAFLIIMRSFPVPAAVAWLLWQYRAHQNLPALGAENLRVTPGWAVAWWFVPIATLFMPYVAMREVWKGSDPEAGADWMRAKGTPLLPWWWAAWLGSVFLVAAGSVAGEAGDRSSLITESAWGAASALTLALTAGLAMALVRRINARQERKHERVASAKATVPAGS
jgi:uncharacterized protein DUF4328